MSLNIYTSPLLAFVFVFIGEFVAYTLYGISFSVYGIFFLRSSPAWQISLLPLQSWEAVLSESAAAL